MLVARPARIVILFLSLLAAISSAAAEVHINADHPVYVEAVPFTLHGSSDLPPGTLLTISVEGRALTTTTDTDGTWAVAFVEPVMTGTYTITAQAGAVSTTQLLRIQLKDNLARQSPFLPGTQYAPPAPVEDPNGFETMTDRWRIVPPPYELDENSRGRRLGTRGASLDPYNRNLLKGDYPIFTTQQDWFFVLTAISDTLAESRTLPTPSGVSAVHPGSVSFFGDDNQNVFAQNVIVSGDLFQGNTAFKPVTQRVKATLVANLTSVHVNENAIVKPDVRRGTVRNDGRVSLQELFYERKLKDLSVNYDFLSARFGIQPFTSDFRGFIFSDTNLGARAFGNLHSNRFQYNVALFDRLEKDTNSGLNLLERRNQQVAIANLYWQDFFHKGYTQQFSIHLLRDQGDLKFDRNGGLVRPAPIGVFQPHDINAVYLGTAGLGHFGRINVDHAIYGVFGRDSLNPLAGSDPRLRDGDAVHIAAGMAAFELSYDRDWLRPRIGFLYATGDGNPRDRNAGGFDAIFDSPNFAGGGFSFFNRMGVKLAGTGVSLVERGSLLPSLRTSKDEGQPQFVNPGVQLATVGLDVDVTPRLKAIFTGNYIRLDKTESLETLLFQGNIRHELGEDLSIGLKYRPFLNQNVVIVGGAAAFVPGAGFKDIYEDPGTLYHVFTNVILTF